MGLWRCDGKSVRMEKRGREGGREGRGGEGFRQWKGWSLLLLYIIIVYTHRN